MVRYFLLVNLYSLVLFALYMLFLRNSTNQQWPRFYLLSAVVISIVLPFIKMDITVTATQQMATFSQLLPEVVLSGSSTIVHAAGIDRVLACYLLGCGSLLLFFLLRVLKLILLLNKHKLRNEDGYRIALNTGIGPASFGNILIFPGPVTEPEILQHERAHFKYRHHYDKLFMNLVLCFCFPVSAFYFIKKELETVHEFEADAMAVHDKEHYARLLLNQHFQTRHFSLLQSFFHHPIKRRIKMLYKNKTTGTRRKGLLVLLSSSLLIGGMVLQSQGNLMAQGKTKKKEVGPDAKEITRENIKATGSDNLYYQEKEGEKVVLADPPEPATPEDVLPAPEPPEPPEPRVQQQELQQIFTAVEEMPQFPGGYDSLMRYMARNIKYTERAKKDKIEGRVVARFVVNESGKVEQIEIVRGIDPDLDAEALRVLKNMPDWKPGRQNGKSVNVYYTQPITFKLN